MISLVRACQSYIARSRKSRLDDCMAGDCLLPGQEHPLKIKAVLGPLLSTVSGVSWYPLFSAVSLDFRVKTDRKRLNNTNVLKERTQGS